MAVDIRGSQGQIVNQEAGSNSQIVLSRWPYLGSNGAYSLAAGSGLIATVAAGTATAGGLFAMRWTHASKLAIITGFIARWSTIVGFTAAQEIGMDLQIARNWTVGPSVGTTIIPVKKRNDYASSQFSTNDIRISIAGAITHGATTLEPSALARVQSTELATAATIAKVNMELKFVMSSSMDHPIVLKQNEGLILRNQILMGAGGTARVSVEVNWLEVDSFDI